jgi:hypothetical protein
MSKSVIDEKDVAKPTAPGLNIPTIAHGHDSDSTLNEKKYDVEVDVVRTVVFRFSLLLTLNRTS